MHRRRPTGKPFYHCAAGGIRQSRKSCAQAIHNHMVVDFLSLSSGVSRFLIPETRLIHLMKAFRSFQAKKSLRVDGASNQLTYWQSMAERVGFEPTLPFRVNTLSKRAPSATRPSLRRHLCWEAAESRESGRRFRPSATKRPALY